MQTLAPGRVTFLAALLLALAGCAHHSTVQYPPSNAFFKNPPPEGVLTPAPTGPGDRPPARDAAHAASAASAAAVPASTAAPAAAAPAGAAASGAAAGTAAAATSGAAASGAAAGTAAAATAAAAAGKPSVVPHDTSAATAKVGENQHVDELPVAITRVPPSYPDAARAAGTQGTVQLQALVKTDGTVGDVRVTVSIPGLDEAAKTCVRQWTFKPGQSGGKPVEAWVGIPVRFAIH
jgi:protein TonB